MNTINKSDEVYINVGNMLEAQLERWRGGRSHGRGIAEYITNSDDSYRRLRKFSDQKIEVEIHSRRGRHIDKLVIRDFAEGMSLDDFENKFFLYFESASGKAAWRACKWTVRNWWKGLRDYEFPALLDHFRQRWS